MPAASMSQEPRHAFEEPVDTDGAVRTGCPCGRLGGMAAARASRPARALPHLLRHSGRHRGKTVVGRAGGIRPDLKKPVLNPATKHGRNNSLTGRNHFGDIVQMS